MPVKNKLHILVLGVAGLLPGWGAPKAFWRRPMTFCGSGQWLFGVGIWLPIGRWRCHLEAGLLGEWVEWSSPGRTP